MEKREAVPPPMPQKRNPTGAIVAGCVRAASSQRPCRPCSRHRSSRSTSARPGAWQAEWEALSGALAYTGGAAAAIGRALDGLEVDAARMRADLDLTGGQVVAERIALLLTDRLGRTSARALVRDASFRASASGRSLGEEIAELDTGLTGDEIPA